MSDYVDHTNAARAYLEKLSKRPSDETLVAAAKAEAYLALAAAIAERGRPSDASRQGN